MNKNQEIILAVDVSSNNLEAFISDGKSVLLRKEFQNNKSGCSSLIRTSQKYKVSRCALEATGGYEQLITEYFYKSKITVNILNPARVRRYAQGIGVLAKTDRIDSYVIERYAREVKPKSNFESSKSQLMLKRLVTRRNSLKNMIVAEKNRKRIADKVISKSIDRVTKLLEKEVVEIDKTINNILKTDIELQNKVNALTVQKGVGKITACCLVGLMPELGYLNNKQVASLSGLAPFSRDSGKMKGKRYIQAGRFLVRKSLYMPAWVSVMYDHKMKNIYNRLTDRGKPPKVAIVAVMRKMIITANMNMKLYYKNLKKTVDF
jgi:transposase